MSTKKKPQGSVRLADVQIENAGSLFLFHACTQAAKEWVNLHVPSDATYWAGSLVVEPRYALDLAVGSRGAPI